MTNGLLDPNQFLNLLVDSLKYQDPLNPTNSASFLSQLAALSQVQSLQTIQETDATSTAVKLLGQRVSGTDGSGNAVSGVVTGIALTAYGPVLNVGDTSLTLAEIANIGAQAGAAAGSTNSGAGSTTATISSTTQSTA